MPAATIGDLKPDARHMRAKSMRTDPLYSGTYFRKELIYGLCSLCTKCGWEASHANRTFWKSETDAEIRADREGQMTGGFFMIYNYNRLWKLLIDKGMTKTQMRKVAGISTNILAKMGKGEPVAMDSLAKIATALNCGLNDIVEISNNSDKER